MRRLIAAIIIVAILAVGGLVLVSLLNKPPVATPAKPVEPPIVPGPKYQVIGRSVQGRKIESYTYSSGQTKLLFIGGIHGGYEWNTALLAYQLMDYLKQNPNAIPTNLAVTIIPSINPDGVFAVTGKEGRFTIADVSTSTATLAAGRFNAHQVDLNRNFDCRWEPTGTWRAKTVSAGSRAFSEPEATALKNFILTEKPAAVIFWHSQSNAVYASACQAGILPGTLKIMNAYSQASGYPAVKNFAAYAVTGAADDWLASLGVPAISVELKTHETVEWERNLAGIKALFWLFKS